MLPPFHPSTHPPTLHLALTPIYHPVARPPSPPPAPARDFTSFASSSTPFLPIAGHPRLRPLDGLDCPRHPDRTSPRLKHAGGYCGCDSQKDTDTPTQPGRASAAWTTRALCDCRELIGIGSGATNLADSHPRSLFAHDLSFGRRQSFRLPTNRAFFFLLAASASARSLDCIAVFRDEPQPPSLSTAFFFLVPKPTPNNRSTQGRPSVPCDTVSDRQDIDPKIAFWAPPITFPLAAAPDGPLAREAAPDALQHQTTGCSMHGAQACTH